MKVIDNPYNLLWESCLAFVPSTCLCICFSKFNLFLLLHFFMKAIKPTNTTLLRDNVEEWRTNLSLIGGPKLCNVLNNFDAMSLRHVPTPVYKDHKPHNASSFDTCCPFIVVPRCCITSPFIIAPLISAVAKQLYN